jgi:uncharacterized protein (DUF433 family)
MGYARGWYACRVSSGEWALAPSKFAGYVGNDAKTYLDAHRKRDGRVTERVLSQWFTEVEPGGALYDELVAILRDMFAGAGKAPNKLIHIHVLESDLPSSDRGRARRRSPDGGMLQRITTDPGILGGRPAIRGMRIGVSDILDLLASGAGRDEIVADYPYLEDDDISAALEYAALSIDHRVIRAA